MDMERAPQRYGFRKDIPYFSTGCESGMRLRRIGGGIVQRQLCTMVERSRACGAAGATQYGSFACRVVQGRKTGEENKAAVVCRVKFQTNGRNHLNPI